VERLIDLVRTLRGAELYPKRHFALVELERSGHVPDTTDPGYALLIVEHLRGEIARYTLMLRGAQTLRLRFGAWRRLRRLETELRRFMIAAQALSGQQLLLRDLSYGSVNTAKVTA
jgi:hypothetical protein